MRLLKFLLLFLLVGALSGCGVLFVDKSAKLADVEEQNALVQSTLSAFNDSKSFALQFRDTLIPLLVKNFTADDLGRLGLSTDLNNVVPLSDEELEAFRVYVVVHDEFYTSLGADTTREIILIKGDSKMLYVTAIWGVDSLKMLTREVKDFESDFRL